MSRIGANIKKIRQVKRISQSDFAGLFNLARPSVGAYEEGRSEPKVETIIQMARHFRISIDLLLTKELTVSEIYSIDLVNEKLDKVHKHQDSYPLPESKHGIPLVGIGKYIEYIVNHKTVDFIKTLPSIHLPFDRSIDNLLAFEMNGSEMEYHQQGLHHGDIVIAEKTEIKDKSSIGNVVAIVHKEGIIVRRLSTISNAQLTLTSDDPNYPNVAFDRKEVLETWKVFALYSTYLNPPTLMEERVLLLEKEMKQLKQDNSTVK